MCLIKQQLESPDCLKHGNEGGEVLINKKSSFSKGDTCTVILICKEYSAQKIIESIKLKKHLKLIQFKWQKPIYVAHRCK